MSQFEEENSDGIASDATQDAGGAPDMGEESELGFVAEESKPNRSAAMLLVGLLILGGGALYFMRLKVGPQTAQASAESTTAKATIAEFLSDGGKNISKMRDTLRNTEAIVQQFEQQSGENQVAVDNLRTNPFQFEPPKPKADPDAEARAQVDRDRRIQAERLERLKKETLAGANDLRVQSIMLGAKPICMINGQTYSAGDEINGYKIESIDKGYVVARKNGFRMKLGMEGR